MITCQLFFFTCTMMKLKFKKINYSITVQDGSRTWHWNSEGRGGVMGRSVSLLYKDIFITFQDVSKTAHFDRCNVSYGCINVSDRCNSCQLPCSLGCVLTRFPVLTVHGQCILKLAISKDGWRSWMLCFARTHS